MKKKLILFLSIVVLCVVMLAISVSATTYNWYEEAIGENNLLLSVETVLATDANSQYAEAPRYEQVLYERGDGFAMYDGSGNPISWYVVSDTTDANGVRNIIVDSALTLGNADTTVPYVGTVNANGLYTYGGTAKIKLADDTERDVTASDIVSANFFGTGVKTLPADVYKANAHSSVLNLVGIKNTSEYNCFATKSVTVVEDGANKHYAGSYLLYLYLPKTLTAIPDEMCYRAPVRLVEFEDNRVSFKAGMTGNAFNFCANLKEISIPEGITGVGQKAFRECIALEYVKFPSTMTKLDYNAFWRCNGIKTIILGENMVEVSQIGNEVARFYIDSPAQTFRKRFIYVPESVTTLSNNYQIYNNNNVGATDFIVFYMGPLENLIGENPTIKSPQSDLTNALKNTISYSEYLQRKNYYDNDFEGSIVIYDVLECDVYYGGEHNNSGNVGANYVDAISPIELGHVCSRCEAVFDTETKDPILTFLGYSVQENGDKLCLGYNTNKESLALCPDISIGILVAPGDNVTDEYEPLKPDSTPNVDTAIISSLVDKKNSSFNIIINHFESIYYDRNLIMCAYVTDGTKVDYLCLDDNNELAQQEYAKTITFRDVLDGFVAKYRVRANCDSTMGTVDKPSQAVKYGDSATITATPNEGYEFLAWSNGDTNATTSFVPTEHTTLNAYFIPKSTGLPVMTINTEGGLEIATKDYYINCEISLLDNTGLGENVVSAIAEIKGRGNSTWDLEKKPYKFKFDSRQNLFGFGNEKTWVLLADHRDYSLLRNMLAFNVALALDTQGFTSKGQSVELYVNGEYRGVYYLCEQIQVKENRVNITQEGKNTTNPADVGYLVEMDGWAIKNASSTPNLTKDGDVYVQVGDSLVSNRRYVIKDPEDIMYNADGTLNQAFLTYVQSFIKDALDAVNGDDYDKVKELIDVKSFAQAYIVFELFANPDTNYSSVYFYKDVAGGKNGGKFTCGPVWDFDMALGNVSHKGNGVFKDPTTLWTATQNPWFAGLLRFDEFKALVASELRDEQPAEGEQNTEGLRKNETNIKKAIADCIQYARDHADAYKRNFGDETDWVIGENTFSIPTYLQDLKTWEKQVAYVENYLAESYEGLLNSYPVEASTEDAQ